MEAPSQSKVAQLASVIATNTTKYAQWFTDHSLPSPSFETEMSVKLELPDEISQARQAIIESTTELQALVLGPMGLLQHEMREHNVLIAFHAIYRFDIATSFSTNEEVSYRHISEVCGLDEPNLRRILRFAMTVHVFKEPRKGFVAHTATSKLLAEVPMVREYVGMVCEELWPSATRTVDAMAKWPGSQEPNHSVILSVLAVEVHKLTTAAKGFSLANDTENDIFTELNKHPARFRRVANTMTTLSNSEGFEPEHLIKAFSWNTIGARRFVDIGGSHGKFSISLAQKFEDIICIVQDLPEVVAEGASKLPTSLASRVKFMAHDFFAEQPVKGADVYFIRWICHDWSDKYCVKILRCLIPALRDGARVIVSEMILPPPGLVCHYQEWIVRSLDLSMLELNNSKEREAEDWVNLFELADKRFKFAGIKTPSKSKLSFIEVIWAGGGDDEGISEMSPLAARGSQDP